MLEVEFYNEENNSEDKTNPDVSNSFIKNKKNFFADDSDVKPFVKTSASEAELQKIPTKDDLTKFREEFNDKGKDQIRHQIVDNIKTVQLIQPKNFDLKFSGSGSYDAKEFTEELFKVLRNGQDSPEDMNKDTIEKCYGGSITQMITFLKDYKKIKENLEKSEKAIWLKVLMLLLKQ